MARVGAEIGAANGAGHVRGEPRVNAVRVEHVAAFGEQPERVFVGEVRQADGALERVVLVPFAEVPDVGVEERGKRAEELGVDPLRAGAGDGGARGHDDAGLRAAPEVDADGRHEEEGQDDGAHRDGHRGLPAVVGDVRRDWLHRGLGVDVDVVETHDKNEC